MVNKIIIVYWKGFKAEDMTYEHNEENLYNEENLNTIIHKAISLGYNTKTQILERVDGIGKSIAVWIDDGNFIQS